MSAVARLESVREPALIEMAWIENISNHGARLITLRRWEIDDRVTLVGPDFRSAEALVVYCQSVREDRCAIGIKFTQPILTGRVFREENSLDEVLECSQARP